MTAARRGFVIVSVVTILFSLGVATAIADVVGFRTQGALDDGGTFGLVTTTFSFP